MIHRFLGFLFFVSAIGFSQELPFTQYTKENEVNPLPSAEIHSMYQDELGYLWIGAYSSGLIRYDGHTMELFTTNDGLRDLNVIQTLEDKFGRLWVASDAGLVVSERPVKDESTTGRIHFTSKIGSTELVNSAIVQNRLVIDSRGWLWIGTRNNGIIRYNFLGLDSLITDTIKTDLYHDGKNRDVRSMVARGDGSVCAALGGGDLLVFRNESHNFKLLSEKERIPRGLTEVLYESRSGRLYGGSRDGLFWQLVENEGEVHAETVSTDLKNSIYSIVEESGGMLWVSSQGSGALKISGIPSEGRLNKTKLLYTKKNGLLSDNIYSILIDREENIWFCQNGGISKLRANFAAFSHLTATSHTGEKPILPDPGVNVILPPRSGRFLPSLIVGTSGGGVAFVDEKTQTQYIQTTNGLSNNWVNGLAADDLGRIWIGTSPGGINCLALGKVPLPPNAYKQTELSIGQQKGILALYDYTSVYAATPISLSKSLTNDSARVQTIWFPGYLRLYCFVDNGWYVFGSESGLPATYYHSVVQDDSGRVWVGTRDGGLYRSVFPLSLDSLKEFVVRDIPSTLGHKSGVFGKMVERHLFEQVWSHAQGAPSNQIQAMMWYEGALWVTMPEGLAVIEGSPPGMTTFLTAQNGLRSDNVGSIALSPTTHTLWVGTNGGIAEIDPKARKVIRTVTKQDGLIDNEVWFFGSIAVGDDGTVYFGTSKGLSRYTPSLDKESAAPPIVRLKHALISQSSNGNNVVEIEYAVLSFTDEKFVRSKTRLAGYDRDWSDVREWSPSKENLTIRYTNLPAFFVSKEYRFEVIGCSKNNVWSATPLTYSFTIQPPLWFRWWWIASNVLILLGVAYAVHGWRVRQLERRSRELEKIVEVRTHEISVKAEENLQQAKELTTKNLELEEKHQEIVRTQEQLIVQEKLASLGALTAGIAHEIKNPLNFVNNFAELSVELARELRGLFTEQQDKIDPSTFSEIGDLISDIESNTGKINEHGKRADSIVRGMLMHSRGKSGERIATDINTLLDEYVNLAYHGARAQDTSFNITIKKEYDPTLQPVDAVPQDLSRVFLNIINNACYAAHEKKQQINGSFSPTLFVCTKNLLSAAEVRIRDNGTGIPKKVLDKVFDPFFTTKPTGKGTGLGLSLSYDIVVKQHKGELVVETEEGQFTEFIIRIPKKI
ncbi:MAG: hypothetical protein HY033_12855 [Ignavibacteriae bacterium]|nr:hypothetical protein [Ignavibacteria bacterium]MBI3365783.1 hypothetical protein [Ignavibacteriota bacterium]